MENVNHIMTIIFPLFVQPTFIEASIELAHTELYKYWNKKKNCLHRAFYLVKKSGNSQANKIRKQESENNRKDIFLR